MTTLPNLLTCEEIAERVRLTPATIRKYVADGRLPSVRFGGCRRVPEPAACEFFGVAEDEALEPVPTQEEIDLDVAIGEAEIESLRASMPGRRGPRNTDES